MDPNNTMTPAEQAARIRYINHKQTWTLFNMDGDLVAKEVRLGWSNEPGMPDQLAYEQYNYEQLVSAEACLIGPGDEGDYSVQLAESIAHSALLSRETYVVRVNDVQIGRVEYVRECDMIESGANLQGANLDRADLFAADLREANLSEAFLGGANLRGANLSGANFSGANLDRADLRGANLQGANLFAANLFEANLDRANLSGANLDAANLRGANLRGANLDGADLRGARGIIQASADYPWTFYAVEHDGKIMIQAGCHWFTVEECENHWNISTEHGRVSLHTVLFLQEKAQMLWNGDY